MEYRTNAHYVYSCRYHIVFCPKYRRAVLADGVDSRLKELIQKYTDDRGIIILGMEVMPDHVHLLLDCPLDLSPISIVKGIKQTSAYQLKREFPWLKKRLPCLWTRSAFVTSVGSASMETVKAYIANQKGR